MGPKRLVLLVEGQGDVEAAPVLVQRLLKEHAAYDVVFLDPNPPLRVGEYSKICRNDFGEWRRLLKAAIKRKNCGGCILLLDGDSNLKVEGKPFCAMRAARLLAAGAKKEGAGNLFSIAVVFACMELESWLIPGANSLVNVPFSDGRKELLKIPRELPDNPEIAPRDAKGWFSKLMQTGYKPTRDQAELTSLVDLTQIRTHQAMRSFRRLENAIKEIIAAILEGKHVVSPT